MIECSVADSTTPSWLLAAVALLLTYRVALASLLGALQSTPSLQRRRLLEEGLVQDKLLEKLLERPHVLTLSITLVNQVLLLVLLGLAWPLREWLPGGFWLLAPIALGVLWLMDLALPTWLTAGEPLRWVVRLFPWYAPLHPFVEPWVAPLARHIRRQCLAQERSRESEGDEVADTAVTALLEEGEAEGILEEEDRELIRNVLGFGDTVVREVMTPRTSIQGIPAEAGVEEAWGIFRASRHSRMPLYEGTIDQIVGILRLKDLMQHDPAAPEDLRALAKPPLFVPESNPTLDLLRQMQRNRMQMAVVVDEFGSVSGVVTLEDLLEEVFGEIQEEHEGGPEFQALGEQLFLVSGQMHLENLANQLGLIWEHTGFDTLAGLVMARLGHIPVCGEELDVEGARLTVREMEGPRILQVLVETRNP